MEEGGVCEDCDNKPFTLTPAAIHKALEVVAGDNDRNNDGEEATEEDDCSTTHPGMIVGEEIPGLDGEEDSESEFDENEGSRLFEEGDIVWAPVGSGTLPDKVISLNSVPASKRRAVQTEQVRSI